METVLTSVMPHVVSPANGEEPSVLQESKRWLRNGNELTFYGFDEEEIAVFNWDNVVQITPVTEEEAEKVARDLHNG